MSHVRIGAMSDFEDRLYQFKWEHRMDMQSDLFDYCPNNLCWTDDTIAPHNGTQLFHLRFRGRIILFINTGDVSITVNLCSLSWILARGVNI